MHGRPGRAAWGATNLGRPNLAPEVSRTDNGTQKVGTNCAQRQPKNADAAEKTANGVVCTLKMALIATMFEVEPSTRAISPTASIGCPGTISEVACWNRMGIGWRTIASAERLE